MKELTEINIALLAHPVAYGIFTILVWEFSKKLFKVVYIALRK